MKAFFPYDIPFVGLSDGLHKYTYEIDNGFFSLFPQSSIHEGDFVVKLDFDKQPTLLSLKFNISGIFKSLCDRCLSPITIKESAKQALYVKFSDVESAKEEENLVFLPHETSVINVAQWIYEFIHLFIPSRQTCEISSNREGCDENIISILEVEKEEIKEKDPRWNALESFTNSNKNQK